MKTLVVDDHALYRDGLASFIRSLIPNALVVEADSQRTAQDAIAGERFELALVDLRLPDGSGLCLIERLTALDPLLPVVAVSAMDGWDVVDKALSVGASGFLPKHLPRDAMAEAFERIMAGEIWSPYGKAGLSAAHMTGPAGTIPPPVRERLTPRQCDVLGLLAQGLSNKEIARQLGIAEKTVKTHLSAIFAALQVGSRAEAVVRTLEQRLMT